MHTQNEIDIDIRQLITNSLIEWDGKVAAVVVTAGCNWRCPYCHSWRFVKADGIRTMDKIDPDTVLSLLERQQGWINGVVISGGEPTLQPGLIKFAREVKKKKVKIKLHTNGSRPTVIEQMMSEGLLDCLSLDFKVPIDMRLYDMAGRSEATLVHDVWGSFHLAEIAPHRGIEVEYHTTLCPKYIDINTFEQMAGWLHPAGLWILQQYEPTDVLNSEKAGFKQYTMEELEEFKNVAERAGYRVHLRTGHTL